MTESKPSPNSEPAITQPREIPSQELFLGTRSIIITHSGEHYRLLITRNDKLILQK